MGVTHHTRKTLRAVGTRLSRAKVRVKSRLGLFGDLEILAFRSHGTRDGLVVKGRLQEKGGAEDPVPEHGMLRNVLNMIRRLESDEIPDARLWATYREAKLELATDGEGFFRGELRPRGPLRPGWHRVNLFLLESPAGEADVRGSAEIFVPAPSSEFGIISDLDDTVIRAGATDLVTKLRVIFANNAHTRAGFAGISRFYRALERGPDGKGRNPIFYVSLSGWGLYDLFVRFLDYHGMPPGPTFLQDVALMEEKSAVMGSHQHKLDSISEILESYPDLPFVLIGDSGQRDPEDYREIVKRYPGRVRAIFVRDVTPPERDGEVRSIAAELEKGGTPVFVAEHSVELAESAAEKGLIAPDSLPAVRHAMEEEERDSGDDPV